jgi:hypothetical protein
VIVAIDDGIAEGRQLIGGKLFAVLTEGLAGCFRHNKRMVPAPPNRVKYST